MQSKALLITIAITAVALSGCASDAPSGEFNGGSLATAANGSYVLDAQPANNPYPYAGTPLEELLQCSPDNLAGPVGGETCSDAYSTVSISSIELPIASGYMLYLNGTNGEKHIGPLEGEEGTYSIEKTFPGEDFTDMYSEAQIRYNDLVIATAPGNGGGFAVADSLGGSKVDAEFSGSKLTYTITGLPAGSSYTAWLVGENEETGALDHMAEFTVSNGSGEHMADMNIADYSEFHVHASGSSINVLKISIP